MSDMLSYVHDFNNYPITNLIENMLHLPKDRVDIFERAYQYTAPACYDELYLMILVTK